MGRVSIIYNRPHTGCYTKIYKLHLCLRLVIKRRPSLSTVRVCAAIELIKRRSPGPSVMHSVSHTAFAPQDSNVGLCSV